MLSIRFTYNTITPKSATKGDFADTGYCSEYGAPFTSNIEESRMIPDEDVELWSELGDLEYYTRRAIDLGISEPNSSDISSNTWFSSIDPDSDYSTGEDKYYSLHISGLTDSEMQEIGLMLSNGYLSDNNEFWLESLEEQLLVATANKQ